MGQKITLKLGGIPYSIPVESEEEERLLRKAAEDVNSAVDDYLKRFPNLPLDRFFPLIALSAKRRVLMLSEERAKLKGEVARLEKSVQEYLDNIDSTAVS